MDTKPLKQKILDLAIRGKLVPQDPKDEPASVLLERIRKEKEQLIAAGKLKKSKSKTTDTPHYENVPFEIPDSWEWVRLIDIASFGGGKTPSMNITGYWQQGIHLWVTSKDMKSDRISDSQMKISDEALSIMTQYDAGTILIVTRSGILRHSLPLAILDKKATVNQDLKTISLYIQEVCQYIFYAIKANENLILKKYHKDGTTVDSINFEEFVNIYLPIPPLAEQKRIVAEIAQCFALIDEIETNKNDLQETIKTTKSKVLDLAIHGKLVSQDPTDEPAIELLRRINPAFVPCDTSHYENLPNNWTVCQLSDVIDLLDNKRQPIKADERARRIKGKEILYPYYGATGFAGYIDNYLIDGKFILLGEDGAPFLDKYAEKAYAVEGKIWVNNHAHVLQPKIDFDYLKIYLNAFDYYGIAKGTTRLKLTQGDMNQIPVWAPPLQEQKRISSKVQAIFSTIDKITAEL